MELLPFKQLPLGARIAIEWLILCPEKRTQSQLDELLRLYAESTGAVLDERIRESARAICRQRFEGSYSESA